MSDYHKQALNLARDGKWDEAHRTIQPHSDKLSCLIHAYLHRVEGDLWNAGYWYDRAGEVMPDSTLDDEWLRLSEQLSQP